MTPRIEARPRPAESAANTSDDVALSIQNLRVDYGASTAVHDLSLQVRAGEFISLLGPSGCGKTTTLRAIAGLNSISAGTIQIGGRTVAGPGVHVATEHRPLNMVFQSYAVWPHLTVRQNVGYGVKKRGTTAQQVKTRVDETLAAVGLAHYADRYGTELSGGQQQRVALARALATRPTLMLYDEPLSNLDTGLRERVREQIVALHNEFHTTTIYVTHDQSEALSMSDRVVLMDAGRIAQESAPRDLYHRPLSRFAAGFVGPINGFDATVRESRQDGVVLDLDEVPGGSLQVTGLDHRQISPGDRGTAIVRPEYFELRPERAPSAANQFSGVVSRAAFVGPRIQCTVDIGVRELTLEVDGFWPIEDGSTISFVADAAKVIWIPAETSTTA